MPKVQVSRSSMDGCISRSGDTLHEAFASCLLSLDPPRIFHELAEIVTRVVGLATEEQYTADDCPVRGDVDELHRVASRILETYRAFDESRSPPGPL